MLFCSGSAADLSKAAMVQTEAALARKPELDAKLLIHIHDELVWEVLAEHTQAFCGELSQVMPLVNSITCFFPYSSS